MKNSELKKFLVNHGFEDIGGDNEGQMYQSDHISVFFHRGTQKRSISFAHSSDGYYDIKNATIDQIKSVISIFKEMKFYSTDKEMPKEKFKKVVLNILKDFLEQPQSKK